MDPPPPPPPPHGGNPQGGRSGGLPPGNYDIFVIPPHASGSGFLYLPSLQTHRNSFLAGVACTAVAIMVWTVIEPFAKQWFQTLMTIEGPGVLVLVISVGIAAWAFGKTQGEVPKPAGARYGAGGSRSPGAGAPPQPGPSHPGGSSHFPHNSSAGPPPPNPSAGPPPPNPSGGPPPFNPSAGSAPPPRSSWQRPSPQTPGAGRASKNSWEKAREETRRKEQDRKKAEEEQKKAEEEERKAEEAKKRREEIERHLQNLKEEAEKERQELKQKLRDEAEKERQKLREEAEKLRVEAEKERQEQREKEAKEREKVQKAKEREEREKRREAERAERAARLEKAQQQKKEREAAAAKAREEAGEPKPPQPTATTETDDDAYSFRPYDRPKRSVPKTASTASTYSESSYAPSQTTARTTPPPSRRGAYSTNDPDKIIIKAVYSFNNAFQRTPVAQLISGKGNVTDGLILRITTEGLFIDDDVRGVPQREWDVKAWTMKAAESCEISGLHVLRAIIRDQEGKKYVFILSQSESWKVAVGLQRLRRGSQVRSLGVSGIPPNEATALIEALGWA